MTPYIITDPTGEIVGSGAVPAGDLAIQSVPEGFTLIPNVTGRPGRDRWDGAVVPIPVPEPTLDERKARLVERLATRRWAIETGGCDLGGMWVETDDRSKLLVSNAANRARGDSTYTVRWKIGPGQFVMLDAATILAIEAAVFSHVQAAFAREAELTDAIDAADEATLPEVAAAVDAFWP